MYAYRTQPVIVPIHNNVQPYEMSIRNDNVLLDAAEEESIEKESETNKIMEKPNKQNSLYLTIKQVYFDEIMAGTKKEEYRDITPTTYKKYLECDEDGGPLYDADLLTEEDLDFYGDLEGFLMACKNGKFPFLFRENILYLNLAVGYNKVRDTATVEVVDITPMIGKNPKGQEIRFDFGEDGKPIMKSNGQFCMWQAVFHLGKIVEKNIVSK